MKSALLSLLGLIFLSGTALADSTDSWQADSASKIAVSGDPNVMVCNVLGSLGIGCGAPAPVATPNNASNVSNDSSASGNSNLTATIYTAGKKSAGSSLVSLVRVPGQTEIYEIIGGKKHLIPTIDIFYNYGFKLEMIEDITARNLAKYPRVKLLMLAGNKNNTYYLTDGGMIRLIPDKNVSESYGDRDEDIIEVSKKEFNFYPRNQFVFLENPLNRDVFQIVNGAKRYLTPMAVRRMNVADEQIAPVNQIELTYYKTGKPIVY